MARRKIKNPRVSRLTNKNVCGEKLFEIFKQEKTKFYFLIKFYTTYTKVWKISKNILYIYIPFLQQSIIKNSWNIQHVAG